jgi:hypothetical protein
MKLVTALPLTRAFALPMAVATTALLVLLLLGPVAPASAHPVSKSCRHVAFTPNSDDMAAGIRARGVSCAFARDFIRVFDAAPAERYGDYTCSWRSVDSPDSLAHTRFRCTRGTRVIFWKRY